MNALFGIKIPQDPWVVVPCYYSRHGICAYLVNVVLLSLIRPVVEKTHFDIDNRIYRLLERFLFPLLILGGLLVIEDAVPLPPKWLRAAHCVLIVCALLLATILAPKRLYYFFAASDRAMSRCATLANRSSSSPRSLLCGRRDYDCRQFGHCHYAASDDTWHRQFGDRDRASRHAGQSLCRVIHQGRPTAAGRPLRETSTGEEGYVEHIGWRNTQIRELPKATVYVPNSKLVQSNIINFHSSG